MQGDGCGFFFSCLLSVYVLSAHKLLPSSPKVSVGRKKMFQFSMKISDTVQGFRYSPICPTPVSRETVPMPFCIDISAQIISLMQGLLGGLLGELFLNRRHGVGALSERH